MKWLWCSHDSSFGAALKKELLLDISTCAHLASGLLHNHDAFPTDPHVQQEAGSNSAITCALKRHL